jgi:hypothetical protein
MSDPTIRSGGHTYQHITTRDSASAHYGDNHYYNLAEDERIKALLLESLRFPEMRWRRDAVSEAREETWLYDTSVLDEQDYYDASIVEARADLIEWLEIDTDKLFWVSGKPGSGKSMFMKSLRNHANTASLLRKWADGTTLVVLEHYFWVAGTPIQSSWLGLLRTLLHDSVSALTLKSHDSLLKTAFSDRWHWGSQHVPWTSNALHSALQQICQSASIKAVFFIDGMDECLPHGNLDLLVENLLDMCKWPGVKICASSRSWPAFNHGFEWSPRVNMGHLTKREMYTYVRDQLVRAESAQVFVRDFREDTTQAKDFVTHIVRQAEGVFLWTSLVVEHISSERRKGRQLDKLRTCLQSFPEDLEGYFRALVWGRVPGLKTNKTDTACVLFLALKRHNDFVQLEWDCMAYYLLSRNLLGPELNIFTIDPQWHHSLDHQDIHEQISHFLAETCGDLLTLKKGARTSKNSVIPRSVVGFPHRTMRDFFETHEMKTFLKNHVPAHFLKVCFWKKAELQVTGYRFFASTKIPPSFGLEHSWACHEIERCWTRILVHAEESGDLVSVDWRKQAWLSTAMELAVKHLQKACVCFGENHRFCDATPKLWPYGMYPYISSALLKWPHMALCQKPSFEGFSFARNRNRDIRSPLTIAVEMKVTKEYATTYVSMIAGLLSAGCEPNEVQMETRHGSQHTLWGSFLARWRRLAHGNTEAQETHAFVEVAFLFIRHGAHTWNPICTADHSPSSESPEKLCQWTNFESVVQECVPAEQQNELIQVATEYAENLARRHTHRRQKLLAFRSFRTSLTRMNTGLRSGKRFTTNFDNHLCQDMLVTIKANIPTNKPDLERFFSAWIGIPLSPPRCIHLDRSRPKMLRNAYVCLDCVGFPTICVECLRANPLDHHEHYGLLIDVQSAGDLENSSSERTLHRLDWDQRLAWRLLFESSNRWFEARAEESGVAMAESPTTKNPYGHPFIPKAPEIEVQNLTAATGNDGDEESLPKYCLGQRISVNQQSPLLVTLS